MSKKKASAKSMDQLRGETDRLARQAKRTKQQLDKVQAAADALVERAEGKSAKAR